MRKIDKIRQFPRIEWKSTIDAPKGEIVFVLVQDGKEYYTELAWLNEFCEWVDIPHYHKVIGFAKIPSILKGGIR